jgi:hypothetical protein
VTAAQVAFWRWDRGEPVPDARLVVCAAGLPDGDGSEAQDIAAPLLEARISEHPSTLAVMPTTDPAEAFAHGDDVLIWPLVIPALYVETQADLVRLPDLLAVKAERRALVVSPREGIDLSAVLPRARQAPRADGLAPCRNPLCEVWTSITARAGMLARGSTS